MTDTLAFYDSNAASFFAETSKLDMSALHRTFLAQVEAGGLILDAGCGSGRDARAFLAHGYRVVAFDASPALARLAAQHLHQEVTVRTFADVVEEACYDGIWACASLLHLPAREIPPALRRLWLALKPGGAFYLSFKLGEGERQHAGRHFTDVGEATLRAWLGALPNLHALDCWLSADQRPGREEQWINAIARRGTTAAKRLVSGGDDPFLPHLCQAISRAAEVDLAVAFITASGLRLLLPDLYDALGAASDTARPPARLRVLTSDYLDVTDPDALRLLLLLQEKGAEVRVYEAGQRSFHLKAYLFTRYAESGETHGTAFIGSSNISRQALRDGLEWNYRIDYPGDGGFFEARRAFAAIFADPRTVPLTDAWIEGYEARRIPPRRPVAPGSEEGQEAPRATSVQLAALAALQATRRQGFCRGLVVLATGLGKTWLSAFDAAQVGARRVLFVAHREEILDQAAETFLRIRPRARVGFYRGQAREVEVDVLCASVQTLSRSAHLGRFSPAHFDYVVIDEFHHAAAATYRRLLNHFAPRFLLGLTATPERSDQSDILSLCDDNLVFTHDLFAGIEDGLLAPFHYYGIYDDSVDYREIPWRNGRFDPEQLASKLATLARARHVLGKWRQYGQQRTLAFCVSLRHAEFMAAHFRQDGVPAAAVYAGSALSRGDALEQLRERRLAVIFSVDLFNEGVDLPLIDTVMMLRPSESKVLFLQQLGRGLRRAVGKLRLVVLDFIGNHRSFLHKPSALLNIGASYRQLAAFARQVESQSLLLPAGCYINYDLELIALLKSRDGEGCAQDYAALREGLGRRPSLGEFYRSGANLQSMRRQFGSWLEFVRLMGDLEPAEALVAVSQGEFLRQVESRRMTNSCEMVLLEALQELDAWQSPPTLAALAERSWQVLQRRRPLLADVPHDMRSQADGPGDAWQRYWLDNPVTAWVGGKRQQASAIFFRVVDQCLAPTFSVPAGDRESFSALLQELVDYRLAAYQERMPPEQGRNVLPGTDDLHAPVRAGIDPLARAIGQSWLREEIPPLFGEAFNAGNWHSGHVVLKEKQVHLLLVTLNKQGRADNRRYLDHWLDARTFHWQSQDATSPTSKRGREIIDHQRLGIGIHLFIRETRLAGGRAARFVYHGPVTYRSHSGSEPMSVIFALAP